MNGYRQAASENGAALHAEVGAAVDRYIQLEMKVFQAHKLFYYSAYQLEMKVFEAHRLWYHSA